MVQEYQPEDRPSQDSGLPARHSFFNGEAWVGYRTYVRLVREASKSHRPYRVGGPHDIYTAFARLSECDRERFYSVHLDSQHQICGIELVTQGVLDASLITPRELYKAAILANASSIVLVHNHPSGDPTPSQEDRSITEQLADSGAVLGIRVLDHIIVGNDRYFSFTEEELI